MLSNKKRILCVEDDLDACELLQMVLSEYEVRIAHTFEEGFLLAQAMPFDLFVLDNWLPDGSGVELCRRIRLSDHKTPIIFLSGAAFEKDRQEAFASGAQAYLTKPIGILQLQGLVFELMSVYEFLEVSRSDYRQLANR